jgi:general secretion pathway protein G
MQASLERLRRRHEEGEGGFTLIELLIVVVILAILAAIVVFAVSNFTGQSAVASCKTDFQTVQAASEAYKAQLGVYPGAALPAGDTNTAPTNAAALFAGVGSSGIADLLSTVSTGSATMGPWLKTAPVNSGHYQIMIGSYDTAGPITLTNSASGYTVGGTGTVTAIGSGTDGSVAAGTSAGTGLLPTDTTATFTSADCSTVS